MTTPTIGCVTINRTGSSNSRAVARFTRYSTALQLPIALHITTYTGTWMAGMTYWESATSTPAKNFGSAPNLASTRISPAEYMAAQQDACRLSQERAQRYT